MLRRRPATVSSTTRISPRSTKRRRTDPETAYFWTEEWQAGEREADEDIRAGRLSPMFTPEEAMKYLREL